MHLLEDLRYGARTLLKNPGFTAIAVTALALGIGVNATVFTLANAVLFRNLPFDDSDKILYVQGRNDARDRPTGISLPDLRDFRGTVKAFSGMAGGTQQSANVSDGNGLPDRYSGYQMTANGFSLIGQKPMLGRDFLPEDEKPGSTPVAILSHRMWQDRYGSDPAILGRSIRVNEVPTTVIGVMPTGIRFPTDIDFWMPFVATVQAERRDSRYLLVFGRLAERSTLRAAQTEMTTVARRLATEYPQTNKDVSVRVNNFTDQFNGGNIGMIFSALLGAVGFVLLIACANVANMLLARAVGRTREISIRAALGASRWRVIRQLLVESLLLSTAGGVIGYFIAAWGVPTFDRIVTPLGKPGFIQFTMDYRVFAYFAAITIGTGILFGLAPALRLSKLDVNTALKEGGRGSSGAGRGKYLAGFLVVTEMALAVVLLAGAGLMIRSFLNIYRAQVGVNSADVLTMRINLPEAKYAKTDQRIAFYDRLATRLAAIPGVQTASILSELPSQGSNNVALEVEGSAPIEERARPTAGSLVVDQNYFQVMQAPILRGRDLTASDGVAGTPVAIVNQRFLDKYFNGQDAIGKRFRTFDQNVAQPWLTVVGVAPDIRQNTTTPEPEPLFYVPLRQEPRRWMTIALRAKVPPATLGSAARKEVQAVDENLPVFELRTLEEQIGRQTWPYRVFGGMFAIFAAVALGLASMGLYAVIAHSVSQRTQEIGVRVALGASSGTILRMVFGQGMRQLAIGLAVGLAAAIGVTRVLQGILVQVSPSDPTTLILVTLVLSAAAMLGCAIPARRAIRVDPVEALRHE
ncbi:MAG TPA: ABC transporter permease [Bryobacteraceae bacterium]|nr:ABC transporter permease [Bryobacteraceae bacterium]